MSALCVIDEVPATVGNLCTGCVTKLHTTVLQVPRLLVELDVTITKQARQSVAGGASNERPLVVNLAASDAASQVRVWLRAVAHLSPGEREPVPVEVRELAAWTARRLAVVARHPGIADYWAGLVLAVRDGWRSVDRAPEKQVVGSCDCGMDLATARTEGEVRCRGCGVLWDIPDLLEIREGKIFDLPATVTDVVKVFRSYFKVELPRSTVESWLARGNLRAVEMSPIKIRVGDVVRLYRASAASRSSVDSGCARARAGAS